MTKKTPEERKKYNHEYHEKHGHEYYLSHKEEKHEYNRTHKDHILKWQRDHYDPARRHLNYLKHKVKQHARSLVRRIPMGKSCSKCGATWNLERHHPEYSQPQRFETVCIACHVKIHRPPVGE